MTNQVWSSFEGPMAHPDAAQILTIARKLEAAFADMDQHIEELQGLDIKKHAVPLLSVLLNGIVNIPQRLAFLATGELSKEDDDLAEAQ